MQCRPVRDLFVDYLRERQPALDYTTLAKLAGDLVRLFWADLEQHHPGIDSLQLPPAVASAWRQRISVRSRAIPGPDGHTAEELIPRANARSVMIEVRAFYLDIAQWALDEPHRRAQWAVPCPVRETDCTRAKEDKLVKARMDQRTRERLPRLPALALALNNNRLAAAGLLEAARQAPPGTTFTAAGRTMVHLPAPPPIPAASGPANPQAGTAPT